MEEQIFSIFPNEPFIDLTLYQLEIGRAHV